MFETWGKYGIIWRDGQIEQISVDNRPKSVKGMLIQKQSTEIKTGVQNILNWANKGIFLSFAK